MKKTIFTFLAIALSVAVFAADQVVTSNADAGPGTLRQAILDVHSGGTITFDLDADYIITLSSQFALINKSIIIDGANTEGSGVQVAVQVTTPGVSAYRIFYIDASGNTFTLKNIELVGGKSDGGGAISMHQGHLSIDNVIIRDSKSESSSTKGGGAIYIENATSTSISNSKFLNNEAIGTSGSSGDLGNGGAIAIYGGATTITNCTFNGNAGVVHGGAIYTSVNLDISGSTFNANTCDGYGGAINFHNGTSTVTNCTFSDNNATGSNGWGGAIMIGDDVDPVSLKVTFRFASIAGNTSGAGDGNGGGIYLWKGEADIQNCLLGDNTTNDFYGYGTTLTDGGYNIVEAQAGSLQFGTTNNILGQQANLFGTGISSRTLAHNGGTTQTLKIEDGSVATSAGLADAGITTDQRGDTRADPPTIGSFEEVFVWTGTTSTDWANTGNWDSGTVPAEHDDVVIPDVTTNDPIIGSGTTDAVCHDLWIQVGGTLTVEGKLTFHHNVDNHGALTVNGEMEYESAPPPPALAIGDLHEGGIVIYLDGNGGGLVCSMTYITQNGGQPYNNTWGGMYTLVGATGTAIGTGQANTTTIISMLGTSEYYSARSCNDFSDNGYDDWFLPSKDELNEIYVNRVAINAGLTANGGTILNVMGAHWSSSESSADKAYDQSFWGGPQPAVDKTGTGFCRAVRVF